MPTGKKLTERERGIIIGLRQENVGINEIGRRLNRSSRVIRNFLNNPDGYGAKHAGGRPQKLSNRDKRRLDRIASNSTIGTRTIQRQEFPDVHHTTVFRALKNSPNIERAHMMTAPPLSNEHKRSRLEYARRNMNIDWRKVSFSVASL